MMMTPRQQLVLAVCIAEWDSTIRSMTAMDEVMFIDIHSLTDELYDLILMWPGTTVPVTREEARRVVQEARRYATEHGDELDELLSDE